VRQFVGEIPRRAVPAHESVNAVASAHSIREHLTHSGAHRVFVERFFHRAANEHHDLTARRRLFKAHCQLADGSPGELLEFFCQLPRDDRWDALARGAMRDDLYAVLESLTRSVLATSSAGLAPAKRFDEWADANKDALARARTALGGIERLDHAGIAALSVALRTLRGILRGGGRSS